MVVVVEGVELSIVDPSVGVCVVVGTPGTDVGAEFSKKANDKRKTVEGVGNRKRVNE